jgi:hypothetical protein
MAIKKLLRLGRGSLPRGSTQVLNSIYRLISSALVGGNGPFRHPILSPTGDLRDTLTGGFLTYPVEGAFSR